MSAEKVTHIILVKGAGEDTVYIMATEDYVIQGFKSEKAAKEYFLGSYESAHHRSYEGSMSACIHFLMFLPRVVAVSGLEDIKNRIAAVEPHASILHCVAGRMHAITCRPEAFAIWEKSESVPLCKDR